MPDQADNYVNHCYCSIKTTIFYLKEVEHFSNDEIRYSLSHIRADWKRNAVYTAKALQEIHPRWKNDRIALELVEEITMVVLQKKKQHFWQFQFW